jgi:hypothetical protein
MLSGMPADALAHSPRASAERDPIRIVPVYPIDQVAAAAHGAPPAPPPNLSYRGGPLLTAVEVFTVFWGTAWTSPPENDLATGVNAFFDFVLTSPLLDQLAEYDVPGHSIGHGRRVGSATITTPVLAHSISDAAIQHALQQAIATNREFPAPGANSLYFLYLPPGVSVVQGGGRSCQAFCGYHNDVGGNLFYAVMPFPGCAGCTGALSALDALTATSSHELCEAITDAVPGTGWYDDVHGEIGDICAWRTKQLGAHTVQLEWSNRANACI